MLELAHNCVTCVEQKMHREADEPRDVADEVTIFIDKYECPHF